MKVAAMSRTGIILLGCCVLWGVSAHSCHVPGPVSPRPQMRPIQDFRSGVIWTDDFPRGFEVEHVTLAGTQVSLRTLTSLLNAPRLASVNLEGCPIDDEACEALAGLGTLEELCLVGTWITDRGIESLCRAPRLKSLDLRGTRVTDASLVSLAGCDGLEFLDLRGTRVTWVAVAPLRISAPGLRILCDRQ